MCLIKGSFSVNNLPREHLKVATQQVFCVTGCEGGCCCYCGALRHNKGLEIYYLNSKYGKEVNNIRIITLQCLLVLKRSEQYTHLNFRSALWCSPGKGGGCLLLRTFNNKGNWNDCLLVVERSEQYMHFNFRSAFWCSPSKEGGCLLMRTFNNKGNWDTPQHWTNQVVYTPQHWTNQKFSEMVRTFKYSLHPSTLDQSG